MSRNSSISECFPLNFFGALRVPGSGIVKTDSCDDSADTLLLLLVASGIMNSGNVVGDTCGDDSKDSSVVSMDDISNVEDVSDGVEDCDC